jgi:putative redox protein
VLSRFEARSSLGQQLVGHLHPTPAPRALIITCHGLFSHQGGPLDKPFRLALAAAQHDIALARFDFTGAGLSEGDFSQSLLSQRVRDIAAVRETLLPRFPGVPLFLVGSSFGGSAALLYAASHPDQLAGMVTWAAPADVCDTFSRHSAPLVARLEQGEEVEVTERGTRFRFTPRFLEDIRRHRPEQAMDASFSTPLLIIHGSNDEVVPVDHAHRLARAAGGHAELVILPHAGHRFAGMVPRLIQTTIEWIVRHVPSP